MLQPQQTQRIVVASLALVSLMSAALFYLDQRTGVSVSTSRDDIGRTFVVERAFQSLTDVLEDAESGQRGYLLTDNIRHLKSYEETREQADRAIATLQRLTQANAMHRDRVSRLVPLATRKMVDLEGSVGMMAEGRKDEALWSITSGHGERLMNEIRSLTADARREELAMLSARQRAFDEALQRRRWLRRSLMAISLGVTLAAFYFVVRLQRLESFATMCAWSRTIQLDGRWVTFEEYLSQRFNVRVSHGIAPKELDKLMVQIKKAEDDDPTEPVERPGPKRSEAA